MIEAKVMSRSFSYNGVKLPDPDPRLTAEEVKTIYSNQYPEEVKTIYTPTRAGHSRDHGA